MYFKRRKEEKKENLAVSISNKKTSGWHPTASFDRVEKWTSTYYYQLTV